MSGSEMMSSLVELFGGLGLFLYGMNVMSEGLEKAAGSKMKRVIEILTTNRFMAVVVGAFVTMIVQSSSAISYRGRSGPSRRPRLPARRAPLRLASAWRRRGSRSSSSRARTTRGRHP